MSFSSEKRKLDIGLHKAINKGQSQNFNPDLMNSGETTESVQTHSCNYYRNLFVEHECRIVGKFSPLHNEAMTADVLERGQSLDGILEGKFAWQSKARRNEHD